LNKNHNISEIRTSFLTQIKHKIENETLEPKALLEIAQFVEIIIHNQKLITVSDID